MRPLTLAERGVGEPTISLHELLGGKRPPLEGSTSVGLETYAEEICRSGFPGLRGMSGRALRAQLDGYLDRIVDRDVGEVGQPLRTAGALRRWMTAYGAATATTAAYDAIRDAATPGERDKPAKATAQAYREALERLWILDPLPAWLPTSSHLRRLGNAPRHHLVDPALAARLLGVEARGTTRGWPHRPVDSSRRHTARSAVRVIGHARRPGLRPSCRGTSWPPANPRW